MASFGEAIAAGWPLIRISPSSGWYMPYRIFINVLLPAPFSPKQGMHLAGTHVEVDVVIGKHAGEVLGDAAHLQMLDPGSVVGTVLCGDAMHSDPGRLRKPGRASEA